MTFTFTTNRLTSLTLVNIKLDRFYGVVLKLTILNASLIVHYLSARQERAWQHFMDDTREHEDFMDERNQPEMQNRESF